MSRNSPRRVGLYLQDKHALLDELEYARFAEQQGFHSIWFAESRLARDAITPMAAVLAQTHGIKVGAGVIPHWTRNVSLIAVTFSTMYELGPGRVLLGLGSWWDPLAAKVGIRRVKPLRAMRENVEVLRRLFRMETVTYAGEFVHVDGIRLDIVFGDPTAPRDIPIYVGATGMQMVELAAEIADGVLLNYLVSPRYNEEAMMHIGRGASQVGRRLEDIDRPQLVVCSLDEDADRAIAETRPLLAQYLGQQPHIAEASGVSRSLVEDVHRALGGWPADSAAVARAAELIDEETARLLTACGTPDECRRRVQDYVASGCTEPVLYPLGRDVKQTIRTFAPGA